MAAVAQVQVESTVDGDRLRALQSAVSDFDRTQLIWSSGYLAGLAENTQPKIKQQPAALGEHDVWHIHYATETGNSRDVSERLATVAELAGLSVELHDLRHTKPRHLRTVKNAVFVLATHGIGEPPEGSEVFFEFWFSDKAPRLDGLNYSVLALGDSSYADFCEIGRLFDARLNELGARSVIPRTDCDLDFDSSAQEWTDSVIQHARDSVANTDRAPSPRLSAVPTEVTYSKRHPFSAEVLTRQAITGRFSSKDVRHIEIDLEGSGLTYQPGDSLGVMPTNPPRLVDALLEIIGGNGNEEIEIDGISKPLRDTLLHNKEITALSRPILETVAKSDPSLQAILADRDQLTDFLDSHQVIDLLHDHAIDWQPQKLIDSLRDLTPRLYSLASSPDANPGEAHLTAAIVDYEKYGRRHWGAASSFLASDVTHAPVYVERNDHFRLPVTGETPIIMVGAGTGVAPYRAFAEHRRVHGHSGKNWLFFGDRNISSDFLYQLEWLRHRKDGLLTNLDVAFSRDQREKVYVQNRLLERGREVFAWLEQGAHLYVCGDAKRMSRDVHETLLEIIREHGGRSYEDAQEYLGELRRSDRYQRDVY